MPGRSAVTLNLVIVLCFGLLFRHLFLCFFLFEALEIKIAAHQRVKFFLCHGSVLKIGPAWPGLIVQVVL